MRLAGSCFRGVATYQGFVTSVDEISVICRVSAKSVDVGAEIRRLSPLEQLGLELEVAVELVR